MAIVIKLIKYFELITSKESDEDTNSEDTPKGGSTNRSYNNLNLTNKISPPDLIFCLRDF